MQPSLWNKADARPATTAATATPLHEESQMKSALILAALWLGVPGPLVEASTEAAEQTGVADEHLLSYLLSEHPGGRYSGACSDAGACGPFQLVALWEQHFELDRHDDAEAALLFALVVDRAQQKHGQDWRASIKCAKASRDDCAAAREWRRIERRLLELADAIDGALP